MFAGKVRLEDVLSAFGVTLLRIDRGAGHVRNHGVPAAEGVLGVTERVVLWCGLREPHITTIAAKMTGLQRVSNVLLDDDGTTSGVDEPGACTANVSTA